MNDITTVDDGGAPARLRDLEFTDLWFSEQGEAMIRGSDDSEGPLVGVPQSCVADLDELHRRVCDEGQRKKEFFFDYDGMRFRVTRMNTVGGTWYTLRRAMWPIPRLGTLPGIPNGVLRYLGYLGKKGKHGKGLIIVAGATSAGKTTTACSLLQEYLIHYGDMAVTIEDPPELPLDGPHGRFGHCLQTPVENGNFAAAMKDSMRHAPRYILLGEVRSGDEATQAIRAGITGHLVITTIHAGSVTEAIQSMLKLLGTAENMELARSVLAEGLAGVVHQELVKVPGRQGRQIKLGYLFPGDDASIRTLIRTGKLEQLSTAIEMQSTRVMNNKLPIGD